PAVDEGRDEAPGLARKGGPPALKAEMGRRSLTVAKLAGVSPEIPEQPLPVSVAGGGKARLPVPAPGKGHRRIGHREIPQKGQHPSFLRDGRLQKFSSCRKGIEKVLHRDPRAFSA